MTTMRQTEPSIEERVLAVVQRDMVPEDELPATPLKHSWADADWTEIEVSLAHGRVVCLSVEQHEAQAVIACAVGRCGGHTLYRYVPQKAQLWLMRAPDEEADADGDEAEDGKPEATISARVSNVALIGIEVTIERLPLECLVEAVRCLCESVAPARAEEVDFHSSDREWLGEALVDCLGRLSVQAALAVREKLSERIEDAEDAGN
jgi:hypothetical protein